MPSARWQQLCIFFKRHFNMHTTGWDWILTPRGIYQGLVWKLFVLFLWFWWTDPLMSTKIWKQKKFLLVSTFGSIFFSHFEIKWCWRGGDVFDTYTITCSAVWFLLHFEFLLAKHFWWKYRKFFVLFFVSNDSTGALWVCVVWGYWS